MFNIGYDSWIRMNFDFIKIGQVLSKCPLDCNWSQFIHARTKLVNDITSAHMILRFQILWRETANCGKFLANQRYPNKKVDITAHE